jgi:predicted MPP superfamily phosphohydrolase
MRLFLSIFFLLYGGMHLYAFLKARAAFAFGALTGGIVALFMLLMLFAPFIVHITEKAGFEKFARVMSYTGYVWMGVLFLFVSASVVVDLYRSIVYAVEIVVKMDISNMTPSARFAFFVPLALSLMISIYGFIEAKDIRTEMITIKSAKIPAEVRRVRIAQISDVHLGLIVGKERLNKILAKVKEANPDILVSTGDLVDGQINGLRGLSEMLREVKPRYGKFAVTGNHEFYAGLSQALNFTEKAGFTVLRGDAVTAGGLINIAGVDDPQGKAFGLFKGGDEKELLSRLPAGKFTVLLKHRPLIDKDSPGLFDLQLSGHVHKGQIFPFSLLTGLYYHPVQAGFADLARNSHLYVSRGSGTWGPPIRFLSPPEVTVIDVVHGNED